MSGRRGMTLAECLIALLVSSVLVASIDATLVAGQRFARRSSASRGLRQNLRAAAAVLRHELEAASPDAGDLVAISDSAVTLRGLRAFGVVCAAPSSGAVVLDDSLLAQLRAPVAGKDSARVYRDGDPLTAGDDRWIVAAITQVRRGVCASGSPGTLLVLGATPADLAGVATGAPARVFEIVEYRRYRDSAGLWWLGERNPSGSGWSATSPIAGPLAPRAGLVFRYQGRDGAPTGIPDSVALVEADLRVRDARGFAVPGGVATLADSLTLRIAPGSP